MENSAITCDEFIDVEAKSNNEKTKTITSKIQNFYILLTFLLITTAFLIAVSTYCYLIKY